MILRINVHTANPWSNVFVLPYRFASVATPWGARRRLRSAMKISRNHIIATAVQYHGSWILNARAMRIEMTNILSASGSKSLPKSVTFFVARAAIPSKISVRKAITKITKAINRLCGTSHMIKRIQQGVSTILNVVRRLGRFIGTVLSLLYLMTTSFFTLSFTGVSILQK